MEEHRTADRVATLLEGWGIEVHRGVGRTGVVGVLRSGNGQGRIGLRADMDALPILEATGLAYASQNQAGCTHAGTTATPQCYWGARGTWLRHVPSMAQ